MHNTRNTNIASSKPHPLRYEHTYSITACTRSIVSIASSSRALADILEDEYVAWEGGSAWCLSGPLKRLAYSRIDLTLLQRQSTSQAKHGRLRTTRHFPASESTGYLMTRGQETLYETCACVIHTNLQLHYYSTMRHSMIDLSLFNTSEETDMFLLGTRAPRDRSSECIKLVLVSFTYIYTHCQLHVH